MKFLTLFLFSCLAVRLCAQDDKPIHVSGIISIETFPGPPNFESIKDGDEPVEAWILTTANVKKEKFQLVVDDGSELKFAMLRRCKGKKVSVDGLVWEANSGFHHTPWLISVRAIKEEPKFERLVSP